MGYKPSHKKKHVQAHEHSVDHAVVLRSLEDLARFCGWGSLSHMKRSVLSWRKSIEPQPAP